jgi:hypothetical protein
MNSNWSVSIYRFLMQAYPAEFRSQYGEPVDQAFRDLHRDAFEKRGYLGLVLLWFHVVPDFLFSAGEVLLAKAGDFLKWRFRLQWVVACTLGFALSRLIGLAIGWEYLSGLDRAWFPWMSPGVILQVSILLGSIGLTQSRVLAGRCFRKKQWAFYGLGGAVLGTLVFQPLWVAVAVPLERQLLEMIEGLVGGRFLMPLAWQVLNPIQMVIFGACTGLLQSFAIRNDAITRRRWMTSCALGYYLSALASNIFGQYIPTFAVGTVLSALITGTVLGLITSGPLERILFTVEADSKERS